MFLANPPPKCFGEMKWGRESQEEQDTLKEEVGLYQEAYNLAFVCFLLGQISSNNLLL